MTRFLAGMLTALLVISLHGCMDGANTVSLVQCVHSLPPADDED